MSSFIDLTGQKYGRWTVLQLAENDGNGIKWLCRCDCGVERSVRANDLRQNKSLSCGCYNHEKIVERATKHNGCGTRLYYTYKNMIGRCYRKTSTHYDRYGARGITVCNEWLGNDGFTNFREWAEQTGYNDSLTIERIDIDKGYSPVNCKWIPFREQANNRSTTHWVTYNGVTQNITQWAKQIGIERRKLTYLMARDGEQETLFNLLKEDNYGS